MGSDSAMSQQLVCFKLELLTTVLWNLVQYNLGIDRINIKHLAIYKHEASNKTSTYYLVGNVPVA